MTNLAASILGIGAATPLGAGLDALREGLAGNRPPRINHSEVQSADRALPFAHYRAEPVGLDRFVPRRAQRRLDRITRLSLLAAHLALQDANDRTTRSPARPHETGLVVGTGHGPLTASFSFQDSLIDDGDRLASPQAFAASVHNALAAQISLSLDLRGPCQTLTLFEHTTAAALQTAAAWLADGRVRRVLALFADEFSPVLAYAAQRIAGHAPTAHDVTHGSAPEPLRPFDFGACSFIPGEGAVAFLLGPDNAGAGSTANDAPSAHATLQAWPMQTTQDATARCDRSDAILLAADGDARTGPRYRRFLQDLKPPSPPPPPVIAPAPLYGSLPTGQAFTLATAALLLEGAPCAPLFIRQKEDAGTAGATPAIPAHYLRIVSATAAADDDLFSILTLSRPAG